MAKALIIVDVQNDFILPDAPLHCQDGEQAARRISNLMSDVYKANLEFIAENAKREDQMIGAEDGYTYIVATQDWHIDAEEHFREWPKHCMANTEGAALHQDITSAPGLYTTFHKGMYDAGYDGMYAMENEYPTPLHAWLTSFKVTEVTIVGVAFEHCVKATALSAASLGFKTRVLPLYCSSVKGGQIVADARHEMEAAGVDVDMMATA